MVESVSRPALAASVSSSWGVGAEALLAWATEAIRLSLVVRIELLGMACLWGNGEGFDGL